MTDRQFGFPRHEISQILQTYYHFTKTGNPVTSSPRLAAPHEIK